MYSIVNRYLLKSIFIQKDKILSLLFNAKNHWNRINMSNIVNKYLVEPIFEKISTFLFSIKYFLSVQYKHKYKISGSGSWTTTTIHVSYTYPTSGATTDLRAKSFS